MARRLRNNDGSYSFNKAKGKDIQRLATLGMDTKELTLLFDNILTHSHFKGERLMSLNMENWPPDVVSKHRLFMTRYTDNIILNNDFGSMAKWMSRPLAGILLQFRTFVMGAWTKATLFGLNHLDMRQVALVMGEIVAGMATYAVQRSPQLLNEQSREKYLSDLSSPLIWASKGWSRSAAASILPMVLDTGLNFTSTDFRFDARASGQATDSILGNPLVGHLNQAFQAGKGWSNAVTGLQPPTQSTMRQTAQTLLPFSNWIGFSAVLNALISPLPSKSQGGRKQSAISASGYQYQ